jgi:hypothetical protein
MTLYWCGSLSNENLRLHRGGESANFDRFRYGVEGCFLFSAPSKKTRQSPPNRLNCGGDQMRTSKTIRQMALGRKGLRERAGSLQMYSAGTATKRQKGLLCLCRQRSFSPLIQLEVRNRS